MLTNETVLKVFEGYQRADPDVEVIQTSRGYTVLTWDNGQEDWSSSVVCATPEKLRDKLAANYMSFLQLKATQGRRDLTPQERQSIDAECGKLRRLCGDTCE